MAMKLNSNVISGLALAVSALSATFSFVQYRTASAQLRLNEQQLRPYIKYIPIFQPGKAMLNIDLAIENHSPIPAKILHSEVTAWIDGEHVGFDFHSTAPDLLYQHKGGRQSIPPISGPLFTQLDKERSMLSMGVCVIYTSAANSDARVWLHRAVYEYLPGSGLPVTRYIDEEEVAASTTKCTAKDIGTHVVRASAASEAASSSVSQPKTTGPRPKSSSPSATK